LSLEVRFLTASPPRRQSKLSNGGRRSASVEFLEFVGYADCDAGIRIEPSESGDSGQIPAQTPLCICSPARNCAWFSLPTRPSGPWRPLISPTRLMLRCRNQQPRRRSTDRCLLATTGDPRMANPGCHAIVRVQVFGNKSLRKTPSRSRPGRCRLGIRSSTANLKAMAAWILFREQVSVSTLTQVAEIIVELPVTPRNTGFQSWLNRQESCATRKSEFRNSPMPT